MTFSLILILMQTGFISDMSLFVYLEGASRGRIVGLMLVQHV